MTNWKPSRSATVAYADHQIRVYTDGTWKPLPGHEVGWSTLPGAVIYADGTGDANVTTAWGHDKHSLVRGPDGMQYDVRALAVG